MSITDSPCKLCTDRTAECHGQCERYKAWKEEYGAYKDKKHKQEVQEYVMRDYNKQKNRMLKRIMNYYRRKK